MGRGIPRLVAAIRFVGLPGLTRSVHYAAARWLIERRFETVSRSGEFEPPEPCLETRSIPGGGLFRFGAGELEVRFLAVDLARVSWGPGTPPVPYALARTEWPVVPVETVSGPGGWSLSTGSLRVDVQRSGALRFWDVEGALLREDLPPLRRGSEVLLRSSMHPEERLYGLGNRTLPAGLRGRAYHLWNRDPAGGPTPGDDPVYLCIPVYLSVRAGGSHLAFHENSYAGTLTVGEHVEVRFTGGPLRYYVIPGPPAQAFERYTDLTGRPPLPPRWALGFHQSRWSYDSVDEVRSVADGFRDRALPLAAIHLDIDAMDRFRVFTADPIRFADLAGLARDLERRGVRLVAIVDPGVKIDRGYAVFTEGEAGDVFCRLPDGTPARAPVWPGWCVFPDFTDPRARAWWGTHYPRLLDLGIAGFWHDMNEPAAFAAWGDQTLPLPTCHTMEGRGGDHREAHNLYGLLENRAGFEALRRLAPERRPFIVTRSGWAGVQRYAWTWTGDVDSTWEALRQTVSTVLDLGLSGVAYTGPDIGGFSGAPTSELFLRWLQLAAFLPFFRIHSAKGTPRREPWSFGAAALDIARETLRLRERLLPYLYTLAWEASRTGAMLVRPLFWPDAREPDLWDVRDAFFLGEALLVAPVLEAGARAREVTLPAGLWYELSSGRAHRGPTRVRLEAPLERIPVLVRAGSVLPLEEMPQDGGRSAALHLHAYPPDGAPGGGKLYSDAGDGYGPGRVDRFGLRREGAGLRLSWTDEGTYPFPYRDVAVRVVGADGQGATADGIEAARTDGGLRVGRFRDLWIT